MKKDKKKRHINVVAVTTIFMVVLVVLCSFFTGYLLYTQEQGILDVSATQQDAYVQLVLDQINLKDNRDDEEIISDILSTLDSSSNKYWTFSKDKDMLFVKDVIETNRYKGVTAISYYDSETARAFMDSLQRNKVIHRNIMVGEKNYVASGVAFSYAGEEYRLCLLTNKNVILNNNQFMEAEMETIIVIGIMLVVVLVTSMLFAIKQQQLRAKVIEKEQVIEELQGNIGHLNEMFGQKEQYDTKHQLWNKNLIKAFADKLCKKNITDAIMVKLHCEKEEDKKLFFNKASVLLDKKVLRFSLSENEILLMFIQTERQYVENNMELVLNGGVKMVSIEEVDLGNADLSQYIGELN